MTKRYLLVSAYDDGYECHYAYFTSLDSAIKYQIPHGDTYVSHQIVAVTKEIAEELYYWRVGRDAEWIECGGDVEVAVD